MKVLVVGGGGREHALAWKLYLSPRVEKVWVVPGNGGMEREAECIQLDVGKNFSSLGKWAKKEKIDLVVVGPEAPLVEGIVDSLEKEGLKVFGPSKKAAELEGSKVFAKEFMRKYGIPTPRFEVFEEPEKAIKWVEREKRPLVVKADGLAGGKGSIVCEEPSQAVKAIKRIMVEKEFGEAGKRILVEDKLKGKEISFLVLSDGVRVKPLALSQDHKRVYDGDRGPNTGGMGAYSPAPLSFSLYRKIMKEIIHPTIRGMEKEGRPFRGVLYAGLMIEKGKPYVLEFNVRFGDPETQVILPRLKTDLLDLLMGVSEGSLEGIGLEWDSRACVCVVLASRGYPGPYEKGKEIKGLEEIYRLKNIIPFFGGVKKENSKLLTSGGRVAGITSLAPGLREAIKSVYRAVKKVYFEGMHYRKDIGFKGL